MLIDLQSRSLLPIIGYNFFFQSDVQTFYYIIFPCLIILNLSPQLPVNTQLQSLFFPRNKIPKLNFVNVIPCLENQLPSFITEICLNYFTQYSWMNPPQIPPLKKLNIQLVLQLLLLIQRFVIALLSSFCIHTDLKQVISFPRVGTRPSAFFFFNCFFFFFFFFFFVFFLFLFFIFFYSFFFFFFVINSAVPGIVDSK